MKIEARFLLITIMCFLGSCGVQGLLNEGEIKETSGKFSDALELYTRAIKQDGNSIEAYEKRANLYSEIKQFSKAEADFSKAALLAIDSGDRTRAGDLLYRAALDKNLSLLNGPLANKYCEYSKSLFQKACDLGKKIACENDCLK